MSCLGLEEGHFVVGGRLEAHQVEDGASHVGQTLQSNRGSQRQRLALCI